MKKLLDNKIINVNPQKELSLIEYLKEDYEIKAIKYKNKEAIEVYFKTLKKDAIFYTLECIGIYTNMSKKTQNKLLELCKVEYRRV